MKRARVSTSWYVICVLFNLEIYFKWNWFNSSRLISNKIGSRVKVSKVCQKVYSLDFGRNLWPRTTNINNTSEYSVNENIDWLATSRNSIDLTITISSSVSTTTWSNCCCSDRSTTKRLHCRKLFDERAHTHTRRKMKRWEENECACVCEGEKEKGSEKISYWLLCVCVDLINEIVNTT